MKFYRKHFFVFLAWKGSRRLDLQGITPQSLPSQSISWTLRPSTGFSTRTPPPLEFVDWENRQHQIFRPSLKNWLDRPSLCCVFMGWTPNRYSKILVVIILASALALQRAPTVHSCHDLIMTAWSKLEFLIFPPQFTKQLVWCDCEVCVLFCDMRGALTIFNCPSTKILCVVPLKTDQTQISRTQIHTSFFSE